MKFIPKFLKSTNVTFQYFKVAYLTYFVFAFISIILFFNIYLLGILLFALSTSIFFIFSLTKIAKFQYLLNHGICTNATIIDLKQHKHMVILYCQFKDKNNKNIIVKRGISSYEYYNGDDESYPEYKKHKKEIPVANSEVSTENNSEVSTENNSEVSTENINSQQDTNDIVLFPKLNEMFGKLKELYNTIQHNPIHYSNTEDHLMLNSIVPILYDPNNPNLCMLCPLWDVWKRNHWLDIYPQHCQEDIEIPKQRKIDPSELFKNEIEQDKYWLKIALKITLLAIIIGVIVDWGLFMFILIFEIIPIVIWKKLLFSPHYQKYQHFFYEYSITTPGFITSCTEITKTKDNEIKEKYWRYTYIFTTKDGIPYQGITDVYTIPEINPYQKNSTATILYDPYCIGANCLACFYPYSWIQPEETKDVYLIHTIEPEETYNIPQNTNNIQEENDNFFEEPDKFQEKNDNFFEEPDKFQEENDNFFEEPDKFQEDNDNFFEEPDKFQKENDDFQEDNDGQEDNDNSF